MYDKCGLAAHAISALELLNAVSLFRGLLLSMFMYIYVYNSYALVITLCSTCIS